MKTAVQQWGNSLAIRIPRHLAHESRVKRGSTIELKVANGTLVVTPVSDRRYSLPSLLKKISKRNQHREINFGKPVGREIW
jgi:antitoxin MazE